MGIKSEYYGRTQDGQEVYKYILENGTGMRAEIIEYGCVITNLWVPGRGGALWDVVLGYNTLEDYELGKSSLGSFVGRCANRIENAQFTLDGVTYHLAANNGKNHLHGTFGHMVYKGSIVDGSLVLKAQSPDGDDGFPGRVDITVTYTLTEENGLVLDYTAVTDAPTLVNLTNHSYFNLEGCASGSIREQTLQLCASRYTEGNAETCPTGRILPVAGTPMDFTQPKPIGQDLDSGFEQLVLAGGYDHNFVLDKQPGMLGLAASAHSAKTGITMQTYTTQPGLQLYTANHLENDARPGKTGGRHGRYQAFCLETQHFPCAPSHPDFPSVTLRPDEEYHETTIYQFSADEP